MTAIFRNHSKAEANEGEKEVSLPIRALIGEVLDLVPVFLSLAGSSRTVAFGYRFQVSWHLGPFFSSLIQSLLWVQFTINSLGYTSAQSTRILKCFFPVNLGSANFNFAQATIYGRSCRFKGLKVSPVGWPKFVIRSSLRIGVVYLRADSSVWFERPRGSDPQY